MQPLSEPTSLWRSMRSEGKGSNKENLSSVKYPLSQGRLAVSTGQNPNELLLVHSCTTDAQCICRRREHRTRAATPRQHLRMNPSGSPCHSAVKRTIVSRTPFRQEGKLNGSNGQENWRHFPPRSRWRLEVIFSCMFSKLWMESITFRERHPFQHLL